MALQVEATAESIDGKASARRGGLTRANGEAPPSTLALNLAARLELGRYERTGPVREALRSRAAERRVFDGNCLHVLGEVELDAANGAAWTCTWTSPVQPAGAPLTLGSRRRLLRAHSRERMAQGTLGERRELGVERGARLQPARPRYETAVAALEPGQTEAPLILEEAVELAREPVHDAPAGAVR